MGQRWGPSDPEVPPWAVPGHSPGIGGECCDQSPAASACPSCDIDAPMRRASPGISTTIPAPINAHVATTHGNRSYGHETPTALRQKTYTRNATAIGGITMDNVRSPRSRTNSLNAPILVTTYATIMLSTPIVP